VRERWERAKAIPNTANHVDANVIGIWPMLLGDPDGTGVALADGQWAETDPTGLTSQARMWIDDVWMIGALQSQAWRSTRRDRFLSRAGLAARTYVERLQRPNGLFFHGPEARFHWGRGNGWTAAGLAEVLSELPEDHPETGPTMAGFRKMMDALLLHQAEDGMWRQLVDRPESWKETSGTAMFGFAMMRGVNAGLLPADPFETAARKAWGALTTYIDPGAQLREVCVGTGQSQDVQYYLDRPRVTGDLHGQAPLLWFAAEMLD
jgi:rhamnogalacturonyl hydrolase YesR